MPAATPAPPPTPLSAPWLWIAAVVAAGCVAVSVSYRIYDPDLWQNLVVGKAVWTLGKVPTTQLWTWPTYGAPDVNWTWGFSALLWPVWEQGGVVGLFAWRWVTALGAFGLLWAVARGMGARGLLPLAVIVVCALVWRARSQVRPETLVAVLLALSIWILETKRQGGKDRTAWLVGVAWAWANVHNTYFLGFLLLGFHWVEALVRRRGYGTRLVWVGVAALAISFVNPFGWRALWQPFEFFLHQRHEPIFKTIGELKPVEWSIYWRKGLPLLMAGWPALLVWRWRRRGLDLVELLCCATFTTLALSTQRFIGLYALAAVPYLSRGLHEWLPRPAWLARAPAAARTAFASVAFVAIGLGEWSRPEMPLGIGFQWNQYPVAACDFMEAHGVRGRGFNQFGFAGYQLYRFWPDTTRLPFIDIHQAGTVTDRYVYAYVQQSPDAWRDLDRRHRFDYALAGRGVFEGYSLLNHLDADTTWALVFLDDVMALYVRRSGPLGALAGRFEYREVPAGAARLGPLGQASARDSTVRLRVEAELARVIAGSPQHSQALILLSNLRLLDGRYDDARGMLERAIAIHRFARGAHLRLAVIALEQGRPRDALREIGRERAITGAGDALEVLEGRAWSRLGDANRARAAYRRAVGLRAENAEARDSLRALERAAGP